MKTPLFMHMGWPKTGTTSIQHFLYENRDRLLELGYCYPASHVPDFHLFNYYYENQIWGLKAYDGPLPAGHDWTYYRDIIHEEMLRSRCHFNIMSAEMGIYEHTDNLAFWKERYNIKAIYYLRNYFDFLVKVQQEYIKYTLSTGVFTVPHVRNYRILAAVKYQVLFFGRENCIFLDYDKIAKEKNLISSFLEIIGLDDSGDWKKTQNVNITPNEAHINALFQLSFVPMSVREFVLLRQELKKITFDKYDSFQSNTLPPEIFELDDYAHDALKYQGELLNDPLWYDRNLQRCEELAKKPYKDLPPEIQFHILENLSEEAREVLYKYLPAARKASPIKEWLPSMRDWHKNRDIILPLYFSHIRHERLAYHKESESAKK